MLPIFGGGWITAFLGDSFVVKNVVIFDQVVSDYDLILIWDCDLRKIIFNKNKAKILIPSIYFLDIVFVENVYELSILLSKVWDSHIFKWYKRFDFDI